MEVEPSNLRESPCGSDNSSYELDLYAKENFTELENKVLISFFPKKYFFLVVFIYTHIHT